MYQSSIKGSLKSIVVEETAFGGEFKVSGLLLAIAGGDGVLKEHLILEKMFSFAV